MAFHFFYSIIIVYFAKNMMKNPNNLNPNKYEKSTQF